MSPTWLALLTLLAAPVSAEASNDGVAAADSGGNRTTASKKRARRPKPANRTARPAATTPRPQPRGNRTATAPAPRPQERRTEAVRAQVRPVPAPRGTTRPFEVTAPREPLVSRALARPTPREVRRHPRATTNPPPARSYRPWYTHWYVHPYYRHLHTSVVVVNLGFPVSPFDPRWMPPPRTGWVWMPGYWSYGHWHPGYWRPAAHHTVIVRQARYVFVPGWWSDTVYVEGWWRAEARPDWIWIAGRYDRDGHYIRGHWRPVAGGPAGYVWEPGFFDGEEWVDGFWRPRSVSGFIWVNAWFDKSGIYHAGYWEPAVPKRGQVWIPGWFDGADWVRGYWVDEVTYREADPTRYVPETTKEPGERIAIEGDDEPPLALPAEP